MKQALLLLIVLSAAGCGSIGPGTVNRDRLDYGAAVAESWKRQMLLNVVKLRYSDAPVFLDIGQIVSGYTVESAASASGVWNIFNYPIPHPLVPNTTARVDIGGKFTDRPTITYTPLMGERFARSLMTPIPPPALMSLIQAGYPVDMVFRLMVHAVNGIDNRFGGDARASRAEPEFYQLIERLRRIQLSGAIGMRLRRLDREEALLFTFRQKVEPSVEADMLAVRQLLGLDPRGGEFRVVYGSVAANDKEIAILSRSILEILVDLSSFIAVPEADVAGRRPRWALTGRSRP